MMGEKGKVQIIFSHDGRLQAFYCGEIFSPQKRITYKFICLVHHSEKKRKDFYTFFALFFIFLYSETCDKKSIMHEKNFIYCRCLVKEGTWQDNKKIPEEGRSSGM